VPRNHTGDNGQGSESFDSDQHSRPQDRITVHSAVLDTLGSVHDDAAASGSDAQGLGLAVRPLTSAERQAFAVDAGGIMITGVTPGLGMRAGFHLGDVVLMVDGVDVKDPDQFYKLAHELPHDRPVPVLVRRPGSNLFLPLGAPAHR
jgi:S1-C subfamily serine protease